MINLAHLSSDAQMDEPILKLRAHGDRRLSNRQRSPHRKNRERKPKEKSKCVHMISLRPDLVPMGFMGLGIGLGRDSLRISELSQTL